MKLLTKELLLEFGFSLNSEKSNIRFEVMTRNKLDIVIKNSAFFYTNTGIDYPIKDLAGLKKLYKEMRNEELKPIL